MHQKNLAYFKICLKNETNIFEEVYTVVKPTIFYLPNNLILKILEVNKCSLKFSISNNNFNITKIVDLCDCNYYKKEIEEQCQKILFHIELCSIKTLKPCKCECNYNNYF